jgi:TetR/AcrR family transcriptional regulator, transcriptional repressor for nem operon
MLYRSVQTGPSVPVGTLGARTNVNAREKILTVAFDLFHRQGVNATGLDEILRASKTGKGQFYHYFKSKEDLVHHVLMSFFENLKSGRIPVKQQLKTWDDLEQWFQFFVDAQKSMGCQRNCPIATIGAELSDAQDGLRRDIDEICEFSRAPLVRFFEAMRQKGELPRSAQPESLADFCYSIMQGGLLIAKVRRDITPFENSVKHALKYVKSLRC